MEPHTNSLKNWKNKLGDNMPEITHENAQAVFDQYAEDIKQFVAKRLEQPEFDERIIILARFYYLESLDESEAVPLVVAFNSDGRMFAWAAADVIRSLQKDRDALNSRIKFIP